jgi:signal-transduction protein with cAMP-binding, CBS, and nucleotidyltransferase domain
VAEAMTTPVKTCSPDSTVDEVMATMTKERHRHIPVVANGALAGIVSIGDVVKLRLDELEMQATALERYVTGTAT